MYLQKHFNAQMCVLMCVCVCACVDAQDYDKHSPLHVACGEGHTAIIVALVEEGGADINARGGDTGDTPLMMSVREGVIVPV